MLDGVSVYQTRLRMGEKSLLYSTTLLLCYSANLLLYYTTKLLLYSC